MENFYFACTAVDSGRAYSPKTDIVIDIPTAFSFFAQDVERTKRRLAEKAKRLCERWNDRFCQAGETKQVKNAERALSQSI